MSNITVIVWTSEQTPPVSLAGVTLTQCNGENYNLVRGERSVLQQGEGSVYGQGTGRSAGRGAPPERRLAARERERGRDGERFRASVQGR